MFPGFNFVVQFIVAFALQVVGTIIQMSRVKKEKADAVKDMDAPTAEGGRPIPVPFGDVEIKGLNIIWYGDKETRNYDIDA